MDFADVSGVCDFSAPLDSNSALKRKPMLRRASVPSGQSLRVSALSRFALLLPVLAVLGCETPFDAADGEAIVGAESAIVGGSSESGWAGVGALTIVYPNYGYYGSFCTGTLIAPRWVLTAAHCLESHQGVTVTPSMVRFYVGPDARPGSWGGYPTQGRLFRAETFHIHPRYDRETTLHDIGLIRLAEPATGVPVYPLHTTPFTAAMRGQTSFHVGFGVTDGVSQTGSGVKRSTSIRIMGYYDTYYVTEYDGSGVCFGDSGGPGFYQSGGTWRLAGVNSTVAASGADPCREYYLHVRVDHYLDWISGYVSEATPDCRENPGLCACPSACLTNGTCDDTRCQTMDCDALYDCLVGCNGASGCYDGCYANATPAARAAIDALLGCLDTHCAGAATDEAFQQCAWNRCSTEINTCYPPVTGDESCAYVYACMVDCGRDGGCQTACFEEGTAAAQTALAEMMSCWERRCDHMTDDDAWVACVYRECGGEIDACFLPVNCSMLGGDCPPGTACYWTQTGATDCYRSAGARFEQPCDPTLESELACGDGLFCAGEEEPYTCHQICSGDIDCHPAADCVLPSFDGRSDFGLCSCIDEDGDGFCRDVDCNDRDPNTYPGAPEICGDLIDNNCSGLTDEGCDETPVGRPRPRPRSWP
jgi:hypothetical protein